MTTAAELPELLTAAEAMAALRISRSTLGRMIERGDLHAIRLGRPGAALRIPAAALARLVDPASVGAPAAVRPMPARVSAAAGAPTHHHDHEETH